MILKLERCEKIFHKIADISGTAKDMAVYPFPNNIVSQVATNKNKSKEFSEVFTKLDLVDSMLDLTDINTESKVLDLCSGYGQFSIRVLRKLHNSFDDFDCAKFIKNKLFFSEIQWSSCFKLFNVFAKNINIFIGDSLHLGKINSFDSGAWIYIESFGNWINVSKQIEGMLYLAKKHDSIEENAKRFSLLGECLVNHYNNLFLSNKEYYMNKLSLEQEFKIISAINKKTSNTSWQTNDTPQSIIDEMLGVIDAHKDEYEKILVLFNLEILAVMKQAGYDMSRVVFGTDEGSFHEGKYANKFCSKTVLFDRDKMAQTLKSEGKFDICFSNPPYGDSKSPNMHLKIINSLVENETSKEYVIVHPSAWALDMKNSNSVFEKTKKILFNKIESLIFFNGNTAFGINQLTPCVITHINSIFVNKSINVKYFDDKFIAEFKDITIFGSGWNKIKPLYNNVKNIKSIDEFSVKVCKTDKFYCQIAGIRGHIGNGVRFFNDDFYTMVMKNSDKNKGARKDPSTKAGKNMVTFEFDSEVELNNFIEYLKTDFARICLSFNKINQQNGCGATKNIPRLDFTQEWNDEKLFKHFNVSIEMQNYIREFLPDYYGIRNN